MQKAPAKGQKFFSKRQRPPYFLRKIPAWWGRGAGKPTVRVVFRRKRPFLWKSGTAPTTGGRGRFSPIFSYTNIIGGILSKKGSKKAPIPGAFHCEETAGRFPHSANRKCLALGELGSATGSLEAVLREFLSCFSLIFRAFPAFCFSVIRCADHKKRPFFIQR